MNDNVIEKIPDCQAVWEKHFSQNSWTLLDNHFELAGYRKKKHDGWVMDIYGWVEEITWGENIGKFKAGHPMPYDEETGSDAVELGIFETMEAAKESVLKHNHPNACGYTC